MNRAILIAACLAMASAPVGADDLKLKDGSKISGTIVGFDDNSFKVQTSYGFALVRKDDVVSITVSDSAKPEKPAAAAAAVANEGSQDPSAGKGERPIAPPALSSPTPKAQTARAAVAAPSLPAPRGAGSAAVATAIAAAPSVPPQPGPIREEVDGSTYVNETYGFRMYKPPDWEVIAGARSLLPGAITAMGTDDETTYLLIGASPAGESISSDIDATDQRIRGLMDNFRPLGDSHLNVSGTQAIERRFRGSVDQKDWSGTVVFLAHDGELYTIFGMTLAETDLVQIQENVIARAISSIQFAQ
ncbi:MAG TPA: hypothetical protein VMB47_10855 [Candidatus Aquilonibacter sp.]|nr:hypothetical protein [Candidatus Aquilonibacter sp.]